MAEPPKPSRSERRHPRMAVPTSAEVRICAPGIITTGYVLDTSDGGLAVVVIGEALPEGATVEVELLSKADKLPQLKAKVRYSVGNRHGLEFLLDE